MATSGGGTGFSLASPGFVELLDSTGARLENSSGTLLALAARTSTTSSSNQTNLNALGVIITLNVTVASGTGGLTVRVALLDPVSGTVVGTAPYLNASPTGITTVTCNYYIVHPAAAAANVAQVTGAPLPRQWRCDVVHGDASPYTYSVGYAYTGGL